MNSHAARPGVAHRIVDALTSEPGLTDRELTSKILGANVHPSQINQTCRLMASKGLLTRSPRPDGKIGNYLEKTAPAAVIPSRSDLPQPIQNTDLSEDDVKKHLVRWLEADGWKVEVAWGHAHGSDLIAKRNAVTWIIEAKGSGSLQPMRVNYFLAILGETLQRMTDPSARYSIALPDIAQFRGLWQKLPGLAKQRTGISALFVSTLGEVDEFR